MITEEKFPGQVRAFRSLAEAELRLPRNASTPQIASRIEVPWYLVVRRYVQSILNFEDRRKR